MRCIIRYLDVVDADRRDAYTLEFVADQDDSRVWRVEFEVGQPSRTSFDD